MINEFDDRIESRAQREGGDSGEGGGGGKGRGVRPGETQRGQGGGKHGVQRQQKSGGGWGESGANISGPDCARVDGIREQASGRACFEGRG